MLFIHSIRLIIMEHIMKIVIGVQTLDILLQLGWVQLEVGQFLFLAQEQFYRAQDHSQMQQLQAVYLELGIKVLMQRVVVQA